MNNKRKYERRNTNIEIYFMDRRVQQHRRELDRLKGELDKGTKVFLLSLVGVAISSIIFLTTVVVK